MAKVRSRVLVIDASIARAAGDTSMHPTSRACREFLLAVRDHDHRMALSDAIQDEWNKHQSRFARRWRTSMVARKRVHSISVPSHLTLERRVAVAVRDAFLAAIVEKDRRLLEAALATEKRVSSLDESVRTHLRNHVQALPEIASICWTNPAIPDEAVLAWLAEGAPAERCRWIGFS